MDNVSSVITHDLLTKVVGLIDAKKAAARDAGNMPAFGVMVELRQEVMGLFPAPSKQLHETDSPSED